MSHPDLRQLPSVERLLQHPAIAPLRSTAGHALLVEAARTLLDSVRAARQAGEALPVRTLDDWAAALAAQVDTLTRPTLQPVINATGVILHTNLGRAPLSRASLLAMQAAGEGYTTLEYDLASGQRGSRYTHAMAWLRRLTGADDALVVNNNAAAVLLCLAALAQGREVIISRGQLVEIGGGFRIPDILKASGAELVEVGTTNRTHLRDYQAAIGPRTALLLRVHSSNFRQIGFTTEVALEELTALGREQGVPVIDNLGSGALLDSSAFGLTREPQPQESLKAGATLVTFSGDKLLGGPQAGLIVGDAALTARLRQHPLLRALRVDKTTIAGLAATLEHYARGQAVQHVPVWRMIAAAPEALAARAEAWAAALVQAGLLAGVVEGQSTVGGGALPGDTLPTRLLTLPAPQPDGLAARLRQGAPPVIARIVAGALCFDPRTVLPEQDAALLAAIVGAYSTS